ncbi:MAG: alpha-ketoglutarate-dependent dioxygenase AlkB [Proteobacteria bacterium]|nr:alpha-ketoglutarate-dependent dioxygenase AlkB [Pseudomonadota bacterium]
MPAALQPSLFDASPAAPNPGPEGFRYRPEFLSPDEEARLVDWMSTLPFEAFQFRGYEGKRRVVSFGWKYDFTRSHLVSAGRMPDELLEVRDRAAAFAGLAGEDLQQCLINEYLPGAPIGWHRDRPAFDTVLGVSLLSPAAFRFRRPRVNPSRREAFERMSVEVAPRSIYALTGPARTEWEHSIPPAKAHRYSITFRNFRDAARA